MTRLGAWIATLLWTFGLGDVRKAGSLTTCQKEVLRLHGLMTGLRAENAVLKTQLYGPGEVNDDG